MKSIIFKCRGCTADLHKFLGQLPHKNKFANVRLAGELASGELFECDKCHLLGRYPVLDVKEYNNLYENLNSQVWISDKKRLRKDQLLVKSMIEQREWKRYNILDIGCYTGDLLASLSENFNKYGVEMSKDAGYIASQNGIKIISNNLYDINTNVKFDLIVAVDVLEHTHSPAEFLIGLFKFLAPHGEIIVSTGNADNWVWKRLQNKFWYSSFYEHISFISLTWLEKFCVDYGCTVIKTEKFSYTKLNFKSPFRIFICALLTVIGFKIERFSNFSKDHFCFSIKLK